MRCVCACVGVSVLIRGREGGRRGGGEGEEARQSRRARGGLEEVQGAERKGCGRGGREQEERLRDSITHERVPFA